MKRLRNDETARSVGRIGFFCLCRCRPARPAKDVLKAAGYCQLKLTMEIVLAIKTEIAEAVDDAFGKEFEELQVEAFKTPALLIAAEDAFNHSPIERQVNYRLCNLHEE